MQDIILTALKSVDITPSSGQLSQLEAFADVLVERNKVMNLTGITDPEGIAYNHFADSAAPLPMIPRDARVIDVGTGAGFPGMPMKILRPDIDMTLFDSLLKRIEFLEDACAAVGISARCVHGRAEEAGRDPEFREQFDCAVSRAVARLDMLCELCLPFVMPGGAFLAMKSSHAEEEASAADSVCAELGAVRESVFDYNIRGVACRVYVIRKTARTPDAYPRRFAKMKKIYGIKQ